MCCGRKDCKNCNPCHWCAASGRNYAEAHYAKMNVVPPCIHCDGTGLKQDLVLEMRAILTAHRATFEAMTEQDYREFKRQRAERYANA